MVAEQNFQANIKAKVSGMHLKIDSPLYAKSIARRFLERYHTIVPKDAFLDGRTWVVIMDMGQENEDILHVNIDAETGRIEAVKLIHDISIFQA